MLHLYDTVHERGDSSQCILTRNIRYLTCTCAVLSFKIYGWLARTTHTWWRFHISSTHLTHYRQILRNWSFNQTLPPFKCLLLSAFLLCCTRQSCYTSSCIVPLAIPPDSPWHPFAQSFHLPFKNLYCLLMSSTIDIRSSQPPPIASQFTLCPHVRIISVPRYTTTLLQCK